MRQEKDSDGAGNPLVMLLPIAAVALCCGGPLLFGLLASAGIAAAVDGLLPLAGLLLVAALAIVGAVWLVRLRGSGSGRCAVPPPETASKQRSEGLPR